MQAAEAGCVACYTEIPTDDVALQVPFPAVILLWQRDPKSYESSKFGHLAGLVRGGVIRTTTDKGSKLLQLAAFLQFNCTWIESGTMRC